MVKNLPVNSGDTGLIPGLERFHMLQGKSAQCAAAAEPALYAHVPQEKQPQREACKPTQRTRILHMQQQRPSMPKNKCDFKMYNNMF